MSATIISKVLIKAGFGGDPEAALVATTGLTPRGDGRDAVRATQAVVRATVDGYWGPETEAACEVYLRAANWRPTQDVSDDHPETQWPRYADASAFYGEPGSNWVWFDLPYTMAYSWVPEKPVTRLKFNRRCGASAVGVLEAIRDHYGDDGIEQLGLNLCGGVGNVRKIRGGSRLSTHSWASAIDFDPVRNGLRTKAPQARLSHPDAVAFWEFWEAEGWVSLGRTKDYDWMHVQAMR